jgi:hypothetical protein
VLCLRDLPSRLLPNHRGLSSVPAAVHYLRSLVPGDAFHFVRLIKVSVQVKVKIDSRGTYINAWQSALTKDPGRDPEGHSSEQTNGLFPFLSTDRDAAALLEFGPSVACSCKAGPQPATSGMGWSLRKMMASACTGAMLGAGGVVVSSMLQVRRMPPTSQIVQAAAFMGTVLGLGSVVRG